MILQQKATFRVFYLDDGTLGGAEADVLHNLQLIVIRRLVFWG